MTVKIFVKYTREKIDTNEKFKNTRENAKVSLQTSHTKI